MRDKILFPVSLIVISVLALFLGFLAERLTYSDYEKDIHTTTTYKDEIDNYYLEQDINYLSYLYEEYKISDNSIRAKIESLIKLKYKDFDEKQINSIELRAFLILVRGY